ncbi:MAG TPA: ABC transporter substrate-binding protein, partial [Chloroflexota bacterium]
MGGMRQIKWHGLLLILATILMGCATPGTAPSSPTSSQPPRTKTLTFAMNAEPEVILTAMGSRRPAALRNAVHQHLAANDNRGQALPQLAEELPSTANGTWVVRPDGTMQTTYRLRPNVTWHDGAPLTAEDLVFGWAVTSDPTFPVESKAASSEIGRIEARADHTLVIEWQRLYVQAYAITEDDLGPFPAHLLRPLYEADKQQMWGSPYWTTMFVGV